MGGDTIELLTYPVETVIAEKLHAMVALGNANSRKKDFYEVWICSTHLDFNGMTLLKAIGATFKNRQTPVLPEEFEALSPDFVRAHRAQWNVFVNKMGGKHLADAFGKVVEDFILFAMPALRAVTSGEPSAGVEGRHRMGLNTYCSVQAARWLYR